MGHSNNAPGGMSADQQIAMLLNAHNQLPNPVTSVNMTRYVTIGSFGLGNSMVYSCAEYCKRGFWLAEIKHVVTHPAHRRKGYARAAVQACIDKATTDSIMFVCMTTRVNNDPMIALAESFQFVRFKTRMNLTSGHDIIIWMKELL